MPSVSIRIASMALAQPLSETALSRIVETLPADFAKHIMQFQKPMQRSLSAAGYALLSHLLKPEGVSLRNLRFGLYGRPCIEGFAGDFNLSRSHERVLCAVSTNGRVGVDIEYVKHVDLDAFKAQFSVFEWQEILKDTDPVRKFYGFWTRKEALVKLDGRGLGLALANVPLEAADFNGLKVHSLNVKIDDAYAAALACEAQADIPAVEKLSLEELF